MIRKLVLLGFGLWLLGLVSVTAVHLLWPREAAYPEQADVIICLGSGLVGRGLDAAAQMRAEACADLQMAGVADRVVFTGESHLPDYSTAQAMAEHAIARGMSQEAAVVEPLAQSTLQNAYFSFEMLAERPDRVVLVSNAFHLPRSWAIFRALGARNVALYSADRPTETPIYRRWILRESIAIWFNLWRAALYVGGGVLGIEAAERIAWFD